MNVTQIKRTVINTIATVLVMFLIVQNSDAAIDIVVDVTGGDGKASTLSKKVFIDRVELNFPNKRPSQSVSQFSKGFYARARFKYLGNGPLTIRWLVDGRVASQTTEILSFGKEVNIRSDKNNIPLPTFTRGAHKVDVQFINSSGIINVASKSIKYFVTDGVAQFQEDGVLKTLYPKNRSVDPFNFYFRWQGFKAFKAYQIEVESVADKIKHSKSIVKALSKIDVYKPSDAQRLVLTKGQYRWRVKGFYSKRGIKPLESQWARFEVTKEVEKGGVFIASLTIEKANQLNSAQFNVKNFNLLKEQSINKTQSLLSKGRVQGGGAYRLGIQIQNSARDRNNNLMLEVKDNNGLLSRYPIVIPANTNSAITVPLKTRTVTSEEFGHYSITLVEGNDHIDLAILNLTIEPKVTINGLDFVESKDSFKGSYGLNFCGATPRTNSVFSKMVSALEIDYSDKNNPSYKEVSLNARGYFTFRQGQKVRFSAYLEDKGLSSWLANNCPIGLAGKSEQHLSFIAYPVDAQGSITGIAIELGEVTLGDEYIDGFKDIVFGSETTIPSTGQYKISLNDISDPIDLYATRKHNLPQFVHASGFTFEVVSLGDASSLNKQITPNQANLTGVLKATWKNDTNKTELFFSVQNILVSMNKNPLHAELLSGQIELQQAANLSLFGVDFRLKTLSVNEQTALAQLSYQLPAEYHQQKTLLLNTNLSTVSSNSLFTQGLTPTASIQPQFNAANKTKADGVLTNASVTSIEAIAKLDISESIILNEVPIFNGGEFIARYKFAVNRPDTRVLGSRLAIRLNQAEFIADLSEKVNYDDYSQQENFMGVGFYGAILRLKVSPQNRLFAVNSEHPYLYAKAQWLEIGDTGLFGDDIEVLNKASMLDFFNQNRDLSLSLVSPFGFDLNITGGTFGLASSEVTGIDFKGSVTLPKNEASIASSNYPLNFDHLVRDGDNFLALMNSDEYQISMGVFQYKPDTLVLKIGQNNVAINNNTEPLNRNDINQQSADTWYNTLNFDANMGLQLSNGTLKKGWGLLSENENSNKSQGKFLLTASGLTGQWLEYQENTQSSIHYEINGFDTSLNSYWLKFDDSQLSDSFSKGFLHIPYPVKVDFSFSGKLNQEAELEIAEDGLRLVTQQTSRLSSPLKLELDYWNAELILPSQLSRNNTQPIFYDAENSRILLDDFLLRLNVDDDLGGQEFFAKGGQAAFKVSTFLLANGQLSDTQATANIDSDNSSIRFLGQPFTLNSIEFLPYVGDGQPPEDDATVTATPLVKVIGSVGFSVFGLQYTEINHTALGARIPVISPEYGISDESSDGYFGDDQGLIKVFADLKFSNTYALSENTLNKTVIAVSDTPVNAPQPYKAFVGEAELVLINAFSMKGLAEAGLHLEQDFPNANGIWQDGSEEVAYERIGLGAGVDVLKAVLAGQEAFDNTARFGTAGITLVTGAKGIEKEVIELGGEAVVLAESVAVAVTLKTPDSILHAVDNGFTAADKGIDLLQAICFKGDVPCTPTINSLLELSSIMMRGAGIAVDIPNVDPKEVASVSFQTMHAVIPILKQINPDELFNNNSSVTLNDKHQAALSLADTQIITAQALIDNNGGIPFSDFIKISQSFMDSVEDVAAISEIDGLLSSSDVKPMLDLSIALAKESISMAQDIKNSPSPQKLASLAKNYVGILCQQSDSLLPLLPANLDQAKSLLKPVMGVSSLVLDKLSQTQMPANPQLAMQFLRAVLQTLSTDGTGSSACGGNGIALPTEIKQLLNMASHSLKPLTGELKNEQDQIVWALEGIKIAIAVMQPIALNASIDTSAIEPINIVLDKLINTFRQLDDGLSSDADIANGQKVLRMAAGIPNAFNELIQNSGAYQASELMDVYVIIMTELDSLLSHAKELAKSDFTNVDLLSLPIALVEQTQSLSFIGQNEKLNLSNVSHILNMTREVTSEQPKLSKVMAGMRLVHSNTKVLGGSSSSNPANRLEIEQVMIFLELLAGLADDNQKITALLVNTISDLIPFLMVDTTLFSADEIDRFIKSIQIAYPVVNASENNRKAALDKVLPQLLDQAEAEATTVKDKEIIQKARDVLQAPEREFVGFEVVYEMDRDGNEINKHLPISAKEVNADGSIREIFFRELLAKHEYDAFNTFYTRGLSIIPNGGLKETTRIVLPANFDFTQVAEVDKQSLFTDYWTDFIHNGNGFIRREYIESRVDEDTPANEIIIERQENNQFEASIISLKDFYGFKYQRKIRFSEMPDGNFYPNNIELDNQIGNSGKILSATLYRSPNQTDNPACEYQFGCVVVAKSDSNQLTVLSNTEDHSKAVYEASQSAIYHSLEEIEFSSNGLGKFISPKLISYDGIIKSDQVGWNDAWRVSYKNNMLTIIEGKSSEQIEITNSIVSLQDLVTQAINQTQFIQRRVINGDLVWDYNMRTHNALKTDGMGNWWLYKMPNILTVVQVPQPTQTLDIEANGFVLQLKKVGGIIENPASLDMDDNGGFSLPAADAGDGIKIGPNGQVEVGGEPIDQTDSGKDVTDRDYQPDGGSLTRYDDGSTKLQEYPDATEGINPKNIQITREEKAKLGADGLPTNNGRRIKSTIQYCRDKTKSFTECPANKKVEDSFEYDATPSYINSGTTCPAITPVSGVNQELKHQLWVQFFRMEAELYANPSEQGLDNLLIFAKHAVEQGLDLEEMNEQTACVVEKIGNKLLGKLFDDLEAGAEDLQKLNDWSDHPEHSPFNKMKGIIDKIIGLHPGESPDLSDLIEKTKEVKTRIIRKRYFAIPNIDDLNNTTDSFADAGGNAAKKLAEYVKEVLDLESLKQLTGDTSDSQLAEVCEDFNQVVDQLYAKFSIDSGQAQQMTEADIRLVLELEANKSLLGCIGQDSVLAQLSQIASNSGLDLLPPATIDSDIDVQNSLNFKFNLLVIKVTKAIKGEGEENYQTESQLRQAYIEKLMGYEFVSQFVSATSDKTDLMIDHIIKLQRLIQLVNSSINTTQSGSSPITDVDFVSVQADVINGLKSNWKAQWDARYANLLNALASDPDQVMPTLNSLGEWYEQAKLLNQKMDVSILEVNKRNIISIDSNVFLKITVLNETSDVIALLKNHKQSLKQALWSQALSDNEFNQKVASLKTFEEAVKWINKIAKTGKTGNLSSLDGALLEDITSYFDQIALDLANFDVDEESEVDAVLSTGEQKRKLVSTLGLMPTNKSAFYVRVKALSKQVITNVRASNVVIQSYKSIAIDRIFKGEETNVIEANSAALTQIITVLNDRLSTPAKLNALSSYKIAEIMKKIFALEADNAALGNEESSVLAEMVQVADFIVERELADANQSSDIKSLQSVINAIAQSASLGSEDDSLAELNNKIVNRSQTLRTSILLCKSQQICTENHYKRWLELVSLEFSTGSENMPPDFLTNYDEMKASSPNTWDSSLQHTYSLSHLDDRVKIHVGRRIVSAEIQRLVDSLNVDNEPDRILMRGIVSDLEGLELIPLSNGHVYALNDANDRDPLRNVLEPLRGQLHLWLANKQDEIEDYFNQNPDQLGAKSSVLSQQFGVSSSEVNEVILPAINNSKPMKTRSGNRYKEAADVLKDISDKKNSAKLSFNLLEIIPNPEFASQQSLLSASVETLSGHIADKLIGSPASTATIQVTEQHMMLALTQLIQQQPDAMQKLIISDSAQALRVSAINLPLMYASLLEDIVAVQNGEGSLQALHFKFTTLFRELLLLPTQNNPISTLSNLVKQEFLQPLLGGELSCRAQTGETIKPLNCVLGTAINLVSLSLDSFIQAQQNNESQSALSIVSDMANSLAELSASDQADEFWLGIAAKGLSLSLNTVYQGSSLKTTRGTSEFVTDLVSNGLEFSITLLKSEFVNGVIPPAVQPVKNFMLSGSTLLQQKIESNAENGRAFPILLAQITSDFVFEEMAKTPLLPVVPIAKTVSDWNLNFIGNESNWNVLLSAIDNPNSFDPTPILSALVSTDGLGQLSCDLNKHLPADIPKIPPALVLTPFVAVNELLTLKDSNGNSIDINAVPQNKRALYLLDVAAGLSNLWSNPMDCNGVSSDQRLAKLLRQFKKIDLSNGEIAAISTVGNLGLGALHALVPNEPVLDAFDIAWNGVDDAPGIDDALRLGMLAGRQQASTNALNFLEFTSKAPATMIASVEALTEANSPTANALRIVTGQVKESDLLVPDKLFGSATLSPSQRLKYAIPNGFLATIGMVRKALTPNNNLYDNRHKYYKEDEAYGYLKINPATAVESPQQLFLLTADLARNGLNSIKPLLEGFEQENRLDEINKRAMFNSLTGTAVGFSGISGGLQREWSKNWTEDNEFGDVVVEAYGNFTIPLVFDSGVLMTFNTQDQNSVITFDSTAIGAVSGVGLETDFKGALAVGDNGLALTYDADIELEFMFRPMWSIATSGYVSNFDFPGAADILDPADYALQQALNVNVGMCVEATSSVVPAPLAVFLGTDFQLTGGLFAQKNSINNISELLTGSRVGLTGTMNIPGFLSPLNAVLPLGLNLSGNLTDAYTGTLEPSSKVTKASLEYQACASPSLSLNFFGSEIPIAGADIQMAAFAEGQGSTLTTGLKFKIGANNATSSNTANASYRLKTMLNCNAAGDPLKIATCAVIDAAKLDTLWGVIIVTGSLDSPKAPILKMGISRGFPKVGSKELMFDAANLANPSNIVDELSSFASSVINFNEDIDLPDLLPLGVKTVGNWGGWPVVGVIPSLCQPTLCNGSVPAVGGN